MPSPDGAQNSADRIVAAAKKLGVKKIDYLIITHYHMDHVGGVVDLVKRIPVGTFIDHGPNVEHLPPGVKDDPQLPGGAPDILYPKYLEAIKGHKHIVARPGQVIRMGGMTDTIVASNGVVMSKPLPGAGAPNPACDTAEAKSSKADGGEENTRSVASLLTFGKVKIALFGDLSWKKEYELSCPTGQAGACQSSDRHPARLQHLQQPGLHRRHASGRGADGLGRQEGRRRRDDQDDQGFARADGLLADP